MDERLESRFALASLKARMFGRDEPVQVGDYEIRELIGRGGMGDVYLAHDPRLQRDVALKLLGRKTANGPRERARLLKEARTLAQLSHPNVVTIHEVGSDGDELYMAMELVEGGDLGAWLSGPRRPMRRIVEVLLDAGKGLWAAHRAGIVHRDFKPSNVLVDDDGHVRVVDFGVASLRGAAVPVPSTEPTGLWAERSATTVGTAGTPIYMAPEQHHGEPADARADQFAWCATLYEALAGVEPFEARTRAALLEDKLSGRLATPRRRVPPRIMKVLRRGLRADPRERYASLEEPMQAIARASVPLWRTPAARAVVGVAAAASVWWLWPVSHAAPGCPTEEQLVQEHWPDVRRQALATILHEQSPQFGPRAWSWIEPRLSRRIEQWAPLERRSCESLLQDVQRPRTDPRSVCLRRWASTFDSVVESLAAGEFEGGRDAIGVVEQIPEPGSCEQRSTTGRSPLLQGAQTGAERTQIMAYLEQLDRTRVLRRDSYLGEVVEQLRPQVERATEQGWIAARAEAQTDIGTALMALDRLDEAAQSLRAGAASAVESGHLYIEATARIALVQVLGERQTKHELAEVERVYAEATVARLGDVVMHGEYEMVLGGMRWRQGEYERAGEHVSRALELFEQQLGPKTLRYAVASGYLGSVIRRVDPAGAEAALRVALETYDRELDELHPLRINALNDLADAVSSQGHSEQALEIMKDVVELFERQEPARRRPRSEVVMLYRMAGLLGSRGDLSEAATHLLSAHAIALEHFGDAHPDTLSVQVLLGAIASRLAQAESADKGEDEAKPGSEQWQAIAERHLVAASDGMDRTLGPEHPDSLLARLYLGQFWGTTGQGDRARPLLEACVAYRAPDDNPSSVVFDVAIQSRLALAKLVELDDPARAQTLMQQAWTALETVDDPEMRASRRAELSQWLCVHPGVVEDVECEQPA